MSAAVASTVPANLAANPDNRNSSPMDSKKNPLDAEGKLICAVVSSCPVRATVPGPPEKDRLYYPFLWHATDGNKIKSLVPFYLQFMFVPCLGCGRTSQCSPDKMVVGMTSHLASSTGLRQNHPHVARPRSQQSLFLSHTS